MRTRTNPIQTGESAVDDMTAFSYKKMFSKGSNVFWNKDGRQGDPERLSFARMKSKTKSR